MVELLSAALQKGAGAEECFERLFAQKFGFNYGLFFNYGRSAVFALLKVMGWQNEEVVLPAYICSVVPNAIVLSGNKVRFVDNATDHFIVPADNLGQTISKSTKLIIHLPLFGFPVDRAGYEKIVMEKSPEAFILYDCAQAYDTRDTLGIQTSNADGAFYGLSEGKTLSSIFGGMLLLRDEKLFQAIKDFRDKTFSSAPLSKSFKNFIYGLGYYWAYRYPLVHLFNFMKEKTSLLDNLKNPKSVPILPRDATMRATPLQSKLGLKQLAVYDQIMQRRRKNTAFYAAFFTDNRVKHFHHGLSVPSTHFPLLTKNRDMVISILKEHGIKATYPFSHACSDLPGYKVHKGRYPNATSMAERLIHLPCWPGMSEDQTACVAKAVGDSKREYPELF